MSLENLKVVEWSPSQKCFHVQEVEGMLRDNRSVFLKKSMTDYLCIGIFETEEELQKFLDEAYKYREGLIG